MYKSKLIVSLALVSSSILLGQNNFTLTSSTLSGQATITEEFNGFGCVGENMSPALSWENAPEGTNSFAITMYDPDAPTGSGWWHWVVFDIPSDVSELVQNAGNPEALLAPTEAIQALTNYGTEGYGGPCPPSGHGIHKYIITVYALKTETLGLDKTTNPAIVGYYLWNNTLAKSSLIAYYEKR